MTTQEKGKGCCEKCLPYHPDYSKCINPNCPCHSEQKEESQMQHNVSFMQEGDFHCYTCHKTTKAGKEKCHCEPHQTRCTEKCGVFGLDNRPIPTQPDWRDRLVGIVQVDWSKDESKDVLVETLKSFISSVEQQAYKRGVEELKERVGAMKIEYKLADDYRHGYNQALTDILSTLIKEK